METSLSPSQSDRINKIFEAAVRALARKGVLDKDAGQRIIKQEKAFKTNLVVLIERYATPPSKAMERAREIMGTNFIGPEIASKHFGYTWTAEDEKALTNIPFDEATLMTCKETHVLIAIPALSILDIRSRTDCALFYFQSGAWYESEKFATDKGTIGWHLVRKTDVPNSRSKMWNDQQHLLGPDEEIPTAHVVVYTIMAYWKNQGARLFETYYVRTSDVGSGGGRVSVGDFDQTGLYVSCWYDGNAHVIIGLSAARKSRTLNS